MAWITMRRIYVVKYVLVTLLYCVNLYMAECPSSAAMEGTASTLFCDWSPKTDIRNVSWRVTTHNQTTSTVSFCIDTTPVHKCLNTQPELYKIATDFPTSRTQLTILNISSELRHVEFRCVVDNNNAEYVVQSCNMSNVYSVPEDVNCVAYRVGYYAIKVSCHAERVYPGMKCELLPSSSSSTPMDYVHEHSENNQSYDSVSCSTTVEIAAPGEYNYSVKITPSVDGVVRSAVRIYPTNHVAINTSPSVVLQPVSTLRMCPHTANKDLFTCDGFGLPLDTTFRWYIDREEFFATNNNITTHIKGVSTGDPLNNTFESKLIWKPKTTLHNRIKVTCKACFRKMDINQHCVEDIQQVEIIRPPIDPPYFKHNNEYYRNAMYELPVGENSNFQCVVNGGKTEVLSVSVTCDNPYQTFHSNQPHVLFFPEASAMRNRTCKCSAEHITGCYNASAEVVFVTFSHSPNISHNVTRSEPDVADVSSIIGYIALGFVVLFILVVLLAVALYHLPCWEKYLRRCFNNTLLKLSGNRHRYVNVKKFSRRRQSRGRSYHTSQQTFSEDFADPQQEDNIPLNDLSDRDQERRYAGRSSEDDIYSNAEANQVTEESPKNTRKVSRSKTFSQPPSSPKMTSTFGNTDANRDIHSPGPCRCHLDSPDTYTIHSLLNPTLLSNPQPLLGSSEYVTPDSGPTLSTYVKVIVPDVPTEDTRFIDDTDQHANRTNDDEHTFPKTFCDGSRLSPGNQYHNFSRLAERRGANSSNNSNNNNNNNNNNKTNNNIHQPLPPSALATSCNSSVDQLSMVTFPGDVDP